MKIVIVKYNAGNATSVRFALQRLGADAVVSNEPEIIKSADRVIFPGVGEASSAMQFLRKAGLDNVIKELRQPVLGICLGMQLMCSQSEEGNTEALGIFPVQVKKFPEAEFKVPHMGWNTLSNLKGPLFAGVPDQAYMYYVHSFYAEQCAYTIASTEYILNYSAALQKDNYFGVQFHPEKSGAEGERIIKNFLEV